MKQYWGELKKGSTNNEVKWFWCEMIPSQQMRDKTTEFRVGQNSCRNVDPTTLIVQTPRSLQSICWNFSHSVPLLTGLALLVAWRVGQLYHVIFYLLRATTTSDLVFGTVKYLQHHSLTLPTCARHQAQQTVGLVFYFLRTF